ncbi:MAG: hypothetical protein AAF639_17135 [Chloroflexota bacterium]
MIVQYNNTVSLGQSRLNEKLVKNRAKIVLILASLEAFVLDTKFGRRLSLNGIKGNTS